MSETAFTYPNFQDTELPVQPGYNGVLSRFNSLHDAYDQRSKVLEDMYDQFDPHTKSAFDMAEDEYAATLKDLHKDSVTNTPDPISYIASRANLPGAFVDAWKGCEETAGQIEGAEAELETFAPEKASETLLALQKLEARMDIRAMVEDGPELEREAGFVTMAHRLLAGQEQMSFSQLEEVQAKIESLSGIWQARGYLRHDPIEMRVEHGQDVEQAASAADVIARLDESMQLVGQFRTTRITNFVYGGTVDRLKTLLAPLAAEKDAVTVHNLMYGNTRPAGTAFEQEAVRPYSNFIDEMPAVDFDLRLDSPRVREQLTAASQLRPEDLPQIKFEGSWDALDFPIDHEEINQFLAENIPPLALSKVGSIELRSLIGAENSIGTKVAFYSEGANLGGGRIVINLDYINDKYESHAELLNEIGVDAATTAKNELMGAITHEYGHALHGAAPVAVLAEWQRSIADDPTKVTDYVHRMHDTDHAHKHMEDFADTTSLFVNNPAILRIISPTRFLAMQKIYKRLMPSYEDGLAVRQTQSIANQMMLADSGLITEEKIREIWFSRTAS